MELQGEFSAPGPAEDSETISNANSEKLGGNFDENKVVGDENGVNKYYDESMGKGNEVTKEAVASPAVKSTPSPTTKGYGLKKWRRIKREVRKDGDSSIGSSELIMKRGLSISGQNSAKAVHYSAGTSQQSKGSVSSANQVVRNSGVVGNLAAVHSPAFMAGADSENSEVQSSKSSTAASASYMSEKPILDYTFNRNVVNSGSSVQKGQQRKGQIESSKKPRGESVKVEKENSHSSMESDSRSSNFVFMQGTSFVKSNGTGGRPLNFDGENRDEDQDCEGEVADDLQASNNDADSRHFEDVLQEGLAAESSNEKSVNQGTSADRDPVIESIFTLQAAQEALEREVQKFKEIAKEADEQLQSGDGLQGSSDSSETEAISQKQDLEHSGSKLEEATKVNELESIISNKPRMGERRVAMQFSIDTETELENLFKQKIETAIQSLLLKAAAVDQINLLKEQKALASEQARMANTLGDAEQKAATLSKEAEKLEDYCKDMVSTADDTLKLQNKVFKHTFCFFSQLILLVIILGLFILKFSTHHLSQVVPT